MEASTGPLPLSTGSVEPSAEKIKQKLLKKGVNATPKIIHNLRKKHLQKSLRKSKRISAAQSLPEPLSETQKQSLAEELHFKTISREYKSFIRGVESEMVGRPWESLGMEKIRGLARPRDGGCGGRLDYEQLRKLGRVFEERSTDDLSCLFDDDVEFEGGMLDEARDGGFCSKRQRTEAEAIRFLADRLGASDYTLKDWKFGWIMRQSRLQFTESQLLKILAKFGDKGRWRLAMDVVEWVYNGKEKKHFKSRFVYTKLLAVLGKAGKALEALQIFKLMQADYNIYPDAAAYHSIAVTLGQAGLVRELLDVIESMKQKPSRRIRNVHRRDWDPTLQPDVIVFNSVLNACVLPRHWKGVSWVFQQLWKYGLKPNSATYGLAMEVMLHSRKYDHVHELFDKLKKSGEVPKALTYRVLVRTFWEEDKVNEAIGAVRDMERRGIMGTCGVYYELARCLCSKGRWQEAIIEIEKLKNLPDPKSLDVAFTGMIISSMDGGYIGACTSIFEYMKGHCNPSIGTINAMLEVYCRNDMFSEARELFEKIKQRKPRYETFSKVGDAALSPDVYTYGLMLKASAQSQQWEYFENVYKEMALSRCLIDQNKHGPLLVQAAKSGKWHLLEHAFDSVLEAGEIPSSLLFTGMVCQALLHENYERAIVLVNAMAHVPFQVSEREWTTLFRANEDMISKEYLKQFLDVLCTSNPSLEATVCNLLRSLSSWCRCDLPRFMSTFNGTSNEVTQRLPCDSKAGTRLVNEDSIINAPPSFGQLTIRDDDHVDDDNHLDAFSPSINLDLRYSPSTSPSDINEAYGECTDSSESKPSKFFEDEHAEDFSDTYITGSQILQAWRESREKDGIISPFCMQ